MTDGLMNASLVDFYELTMADVYCRSGNAKRLACFDLFFRRVPDDGAFAIAAGLESVIDFLSNFAFTDDDIHYLDSLGRFSKGFLQQLAKLRFTGGIP